MARTLSPTQQAHKADAVCWKPLGHDKAISERGVVLFIVPGTRDKFLKEVKTKRRRIEAEEAL